MKVSVTELRTIVDKALRYYGYPDDEAATIGDVLMYAQLRGNNQGIVKLIGAGLPHNPDAGDITTERETKLSARINGNHNAGMVVLAHATKIALEKASAHGFGMVGTNHTSTSTGAIGYYARTIAEAGFIGFVYAGSPETVAAHGSFEPIFGTNPLAVGVPTSGEPLVFDMTTAAMAYYGLIEAKTAGRTIPADAAFDANGKATTDPAAAMDGALRPFDRGHRGSGLSMIVEILTGPLVAASFTGIGDTTSSWGNLVFAMDPELLVDRAEFTEQVTQLINAVKKTKRMDGVAEIFVPGERGDRLAQTRISANEIEIEDNLYTKLQEVISTVAS